MTNDLRLVVKASPAIILALIVFGSLEFVLRFVFMFAMFITIFPGLFLVMAIDISDSDTDIKDLFLPYLWRLIPHPEQRTTR